MKKCDNCGLSHTHAGVPVRFPFTDSRYCVACIARNPRLSRATCKQCGSWRKLSAFPGGDTTQPCTSCYSGAHERRKCSRCGSNRLLDKFPPGGTVCKVCEPSASRLRASDVDAALAALNGANLQPGGSVRTATAILASLGVENPSMHAKKAARQWFFGNGFKEGGANGRYGFRAVPGSPGSPMFRLWAEKYGCADALDLPADELNRYMTGVRPPVRVRLAMSALTAGLPAWE